MLSTVVAKEMFRVLLALPPDIHNLEIYRVAGVRAPPLGLAWIASVLENKGFKVKIVDAPTLELSRKEWISEVKSWHPDVVGLSLLTPTAPKGYAAARMVKEELGEDVVVIAGGPHPTFMYEEALNSGVDVVVRGEGEVTTLELVRVLKERGLDPEALKGVKGIAFKREGKVVVTPPRPLIDNLDKLPLPAWHLLPMEKYTLLGKPIKVAHVMASRGCPYGCSFCTTSYFWGRKVRFRSASKVAEEVEYLYDKYGARYVAFADDELTMNKRFIYDFVKEVKERGLDLQFACGSRVDHMTKDFMKFLFDNGCVILYFGVESASQETLDRVGKGIRVEQAKRVFEWKKELGGCALASFILGFPWETVDDMKRTVDFAIDLDPDYVQFTALTPYPGTPIYRYALKQGLIEDFNWEHYTTIRPVMRGFRFTREQLAKMLCLAYRKFYLRTKFVIRELRAGRLKDLSGILTRELLSLIREKLAQALRVIG